MRAIILRQAPSDGGQPPVSSLSRRSGSRLHTVCLITAEPGTVRSSASDPIDAQSRSPASRRKSGSPCSSDTNTNRSWRAWQEFGPNILCVAIIPLFTSRQKRSNPSALDQRCPHSFRHHQMPVHSGKITQFSLMTFSASSSPKKKRVRVSASSSDSNL